ncbi:Clavaminate synthase-like protein [Annulohypoxylon maeteangense]|uniref:Clavaminate synthase-like protein n=1 Tax=Annulohypoxylon maeteangense TaxID=1927788 RepID=UPI002008437F|nr:Clavaminate synthase-like protein [Annulohypoxylon maeteangense]KAI0889958.1 Clavaminate synthase-like protein [Annulohypoxylon maeteangense]
MASIAIHPTPTAAIPAAAEHVKPAEAKADAYPSTADVVLLDSAIQAPFPAIQQLFDHLRSTPSAASALNASYPSRGVFKTAAMNNSVSDQKLTIDISPTRLSRIPASLQASLSTHGFSEIVQFFTELTSKHLEPMLATLGAAIDADLSPLHKSQNLNFRLCDYAPETAAPASENGCGAHRDYGTFSIIFQDGTSGLEIEDAAHPGSWVPVPADKVVMLCGWCAFVLSGGALRAVRHRVRRQPGVRRLSAVLFVAPDVDVALKPITTGSHAAQFSSEVLQGKVSVGWFKEFMGKRWRWREGNAQLEDGQDVTQDEDIERLILG